MTSSTVALSSAAVGCSPRTLASKSLTSATKPIFNIPTKKGGSSSTTIIRRTISCDVALRSDNNAATISEEQENEELLKIGRRVRVKGPLKVYHVPRVQEVDLNGKEGIIKQYVAVWKGKKISANLPYKVEFRVEVEGRGPVKFSSHLKEDEFEYLD